MVRSVTGKVNNTTGVVSELELFVVLPVDIESLGEYVRIVISIYRGERLLHLRDAPAYANERGAVQLRLEITRRCEVIRMCMCFPAGKA